MLQTLRVKNLALVENVKVDFEPGLNVVTGETGAGKSVLLGALGLVLGERADKGMIRAGADAYGVEAAFLLADDSEIDTILEDSGLDPCEDGQLVIRRIVSEAGASKNFVNASPTTLQVLKRLGALLVDMHGPHDHQSLLDPAYQLDLLDAFGHLWDEREAYETVYAERRALEEQRAALNIDDEEAARQLDMLAFQVKEIEDAALEEGEEEALEQEHKVVANAQRILELANGIVEALTEGDGAAFAALAEAQRGLEELARLAPDGAAWQDEAKSIAIQIQELSGTVSGYAQSVETDPGRLQWLDDRIALYHTLKRKYDASVPGILAVLEKAKQRLHDLSTRTAQRAELDARIQATTRKLEKVGGTLRNKRVSAGKQLSEAITAALADLGLAHGTFEVSVSDCEPRATGLDIVDFGFAPNIGEPMRPLKAIASSGEISRVMLAIKAVLAAHDKIPVLVFDEIDANVGGEMGNAVGQKLQGVAEGHQVLCITHLPQVAVHGTTHFRVSKQVGDARTATSIERLDEKARAEEIARMLGGPDLTTVTMQHARELLRAAGPQQ